MITDDVLCNAYENVRFRGKMDMALDDHQSTFLNLSRGWIYSLVMAIALAIAYFLAARLSLFLLTEPDGVAVFWPAAGVSVGALIGLGSGARLPVIAGTMAATVAANLLGDRNIGSAIVFALCNAGEAVLVAALIERHFGASLSLDKPRSVFGLLAAAIVGTAISGIGGAAGFELFHRSPAPALTIWYHWFASDALGIITVAPLLIGLAQARSDPPPRSEVFEGAAVLAILTIVSGLIVLLPRELWVTVVPTALLFPLLLWVTARYRPVFAAAAAFIVAVMVVSTTTFGIGILGDPSLPILQRVLCAQAGLLTASLCALVLAALFAERRSNEAYLARSNMALERERKSRLMNVRAATASIAHEIRQPLAVVTMSATAARRWLEQVPPEVGRVKRLLDDIERAGFRASEVMTNVRRLFQEADHGQQPIDVNNMILEALQILNQELNDHGVKTDVELASELPLVVGHKVQLEEVILNLVNNAIDAMGPIKVERRTLKVRTKPEGAKAVIIELEDSGHGIEPERLGSIFEPFVTTKLNGTGLGLAICRTIIERHGGRLAASSDAKNGALFQIVLPVEPTVANTGRLE
jgi:signal transduction histidine kinase